MALQARSTIVGIAVLPVMVVIYLVLVVMLMAINATEHTVIIGIRMAIGTRVPFAIVPSTVDREVHAVMIER